MKLSGLSAPKHTARLGGVGEALHAYQIIGNKIELHKEANIQCGCNIFKSIGLQVNTVG